MKENLISNINSLLYRIENSELTEIDYKIINDQINRLKAFISEK